ncbi:MAG: DUF883 family protein [Acidobacteria bacterium]|nr:DUF883 family protein [Acidobacteriota bacterium]
MNTQTTTTENNTKLKNALHTAGEIAEVGIDLGVLKKRIESAVDEAVFDADRLAKRGKHMVEDAVDDSTYYIKKNPWQSVGYAAGAGLGVGLLLGILVARPRSRG